MKVKLGIFPRMLIIILVILAFFLSYSVVSQEWYGGAGYAPSETIVTTAEAVLITVVLCVSVSLWVILIDKKAKRWEKTLLVVGIIVASFVFFLFGFWASIGSQWWQNNAGNSTVAKNLSVVADYLFATAVILACAVALVFLIQYIDELVLERPGPFPADKLAGRVPLYKKENPCTLIEQNPSLQKCSYRRRRSVAVMTDETRGDRDLL